MWKSTTLQAWVLLLLCKIVLTLCMLDSDFNASQSMALFPGLVRIFDDDFGVYKCTGVFVAPTVVLTAGQCILTALSTSQVDGIRLQPESQPQLSIQSVLSNGTYVTIGKLVDSAFHYHGAVAGWNMGLMRVALLPAAATIAGSVAWHPLVTSNLGTNFTGFVSAIGPTSMSQDAAGRVDMPSDDIVRWHRQAAAAAMVTDVSEIDMVRTPDPRCPVYAPGDYVLEYIRGRDGGEVNRFGLCLNFGERGAPLFVPFSQSMDVFPQPATTPRWAVAGVATRSPNDEGDGHNLCNDLMVRVTTVLSQKFWLQKFVSEFDPAVQAPPYLCPSVSPTVTPSATATMTASATPSYTASPSPSNAPPPPPPTDFSFIFIVLGVLGVLLSCVMLVAAKRARDVVGVVDKARTVQQQFKKQVSQLPPKTVPPDPADEKQRIKDLKDVVRSQQLAKVARLAESKVGPRQEAREAARKRRDEAARRAQAQRQKKTLAQSRYDNQRHINVGRTDAGSRIAFGTDHRGVDSENMVKQADLLARGQLGPRQSDAVKHRRRPGRALQRLLQASTRQDQGREQASSPSPDDVQGPDSAERAPHTALTLGGADPTALGSPGREAGPQASSQTQARTGQRARHAPSSAQHADQGGQPGHSLEAHTAPASHQDAHSREDGGGYDEEVFYEDGFLYEEGQTEYGEEGYGGVDYPAGKYEEGVYEEGGYEEGVYEEGVYDEGVYEEGGYEEGEYDEGYVHGEEGHPA